VPSQAEISLRIPKLSRDNFLNYHKGKTHATKAISLSRTGQSVNCLCLEGPLSASRL